MPSRPTAYVILGYNRDADVYDVLAYWHSDLVSARKIANYMSTMELKSEYDGTPYDWIEVGEDYSGVRYYATPCT